MSLTVPITSTARPFPFRLAALAAAVALGGCAVTPQPLAPTDALTEGLADRATLAAAQDPATQPMTLTEAIARALKFNRERRVQMMETVINTQQLALTRYDMLPQLAGSAGYSVRDRIAASSSGVLVGDTLVQASPPTYSASGDKQGANQNLALTWNVLDFGLSYVRAGQQADRVLIAQERERKAVNNLIQDVRTAYWRALSAQRLLARVGPLHQRVELALTDSRQIESTRLKSPLDALTYQRDLLDNRRSLEALQKDLIDAHIGLATLIGLPSGANFALQDVDDAGLQVPQLRLDLETLERTALARRPELMESRYQTRITHAEGRAALLALLPGLQFNLGVHHDSNDFLLHNRWTDHGAALSLNLFNVFKAPALQRANDQQRALAQERRLALTAAVLGQVHVAQVGFQEAQRQFATANDYLSVVRRIREQMNLLRTASRGGELQLIREELGEMLAELRRDVAYADLQNSYGRIFATAGLDPLPDTLADGRIETLARALDERFVQWGQGEIGFAVLPLQQQVKPWVGPGQHRFAPVAETFSLSGKLQYQASLANGAPLPTWLNFEGDSSRFQGNPPATLSEVTVEVLARNEQGSKARDRFTLALKNTNDAPPADALVEHRTVEGASAFGGDLSSLDADGDPLRVSAVGAQALPPGLTVDADGHWQFNPAHPHWRALAAGATRRVEAAFDLRDPHGGQGRARLVIDIAGRNTAPEWAPMPEVSVSVTDPVVQRQLMAVDPDEGARLQYKSVSPSLPDGFSLQPDGTWRFEPGHASYRTLTADESRSLFVPIRVVDEHGASAVTRLHITLKGSPASQAPSAKVVKP